LFLGGIVLSRDFVAVPIVTIFSSQAEVIQLGSEFLSILAICCWTNGIYNATTGLFQGTGHTMVTMMVDATRLWVFRFLTLYICQTILHMGVQSIWYSVVVSNAISAAILWVLYRSKIWMKNAAQKQRAEVKE
jgi:Na+-driven multidrug efflux pump